jgi:chromosomal replication initiation ATPase DnaA
MGRQKSQMALDLDPRFTFDSFVTGASNRLAVAAARRVAEQPGAMYNPLFLYSESGLGKTHLITAIGHHTRRVHPDLEVIYDTLEHLMETVMSAIEEGERDAFRARVRDVSVLLLDDVQFLAGRRGAQEELLRAWDVLTARGGQVVLASDRPPTEIDGLDQRLLSRFSGGLIADLSLPDYETRVAIVRKKAEESGHSLGTGVAESLAKIAFSNVRELQGGLNRLLAVQELDGRAVAADEVARLLGVPERTGAADEFSSFLDEIVDTVGDAIGRITPAERVAEAILRWDGEGFRTHMLEAARSKVATAAEADALIEQYHAGVMRLKDIASAIRGMDPAAGELARMDVLRNPDRLAEAESLLDQVRYRMRPLPLPPETPSFEQLTLEGELLAVRAARAVAHQPGVRYNPLFVHAPVAADRTALVTALALLFRQNHGDAVAFMTGAAFAADVIDALESNRLDSWRARCRRARLLVIDGVDELVDTERSQEELFHIFDAATRTGVQLVFTASCPPRELVGLEDRLKTRFESGLVVGLSATPGDEQVPPDLAPLATAPAAEIDAWFVNREKVPWSWPYLQDVLVQETE